MAGMLPGVECARRRRFHQSGGGGCLDSPSMATHNSTRRPSFCLYTTKNDSLLSSSSSLHRSVIYQEHTDEHMTVAAREARQRLDDKFRSHRKLEEHTRQNSIRSAEGRERNITELHREVFGSRKSCSRKFSWTKMIWKDSQQENCAVCLELFKIGDTLMHLPCAHRFHSKCLQPWLENNSHCPCCRTAIISI